jgi:trans-aconitate 2-methyltransferase
MTDFSTISTSYREKSLVQASAGKELMDLLAVKGSEDILDVGCGPGNLTAALRGLTTGRVVGIDQAEGMIRKAREQYAGQDIEFLVSSSERMPFAGEFDIIFCNSAFQWFRQPIVSLQEFRRALRPSGRVGMQAPATRNYSPNFIKAINQCRKSAEIDALFAGFRSPWLFLDSAAEYQALFEQAGFTVSICRLDEVHQPYTPAKAFDVFNSGAAAGYLNQACFSSTLPADFAERVLQGMRESLAEQAGAGGEIDLVFYRIFVLAQK